MSTVTKQYRETTYGDRYTITYEPQNNGTWKIYCSEHPPNPYASRGGDHLLSSGHICVAQGREPRTFDRAQAVAFVWMQGFSRFVRSGVFPEGRRRVDV